MEIIINLKLTKFMQLALRVPKFQLIEVIKCYGSHNQFAGSNPIGVDGLFHSLKIPSMTSFGKKEKQWSRVVDLRHVKEPQAEIRASEKNLLNFSRSM